MKRKKEMKYEGMIICKEVAEIAKKKGITLEELYEKYIEGKRLSKEKEKAIKEVEYYLDMKEASKLVKERREIDIWYEVVKEMKEEGKW